jgi:hypothetical protein
MKKLLLLLITIFGFTVNAQSLLVEDCTSLTVGDVGTDLTGATVGQGVWRIFAPTGTPLSHMAVVDMGGAYGNVFQLTGSATNTGTRYIYNETIADAWTSREVGNEIAEVTYDFFTGPVSTSKNTHRVALYNSSGVLIGGILVQMDTKVVKGLARYNNAGTIQNILFDLGATFTTPKFLDPNTWYKLGFSFNKTTGEIKWKEGTGLFDKSIIGVSAGIDVGELDILCSAILLAADVNTVASIGVFDNITATATATDTLLAIDSVEVSASNFETYPNPATSIVNISSKNNGINSVIMTDVNGRTVKNVNVASVTEAQINISDLAAGVYIMKIFSNEGTATKKIIKE